MTIAIDAGNSDLKLATVVDGRVGPVERFPTADPPDPLVLAERIAELGFEGPPRPIVALVSVVPALTELVREAARVVGARLLIADAGTIPIAARVPHPGRVGSDRLLGAWGARLHHGAPLIVVDLGTATTVDAVDAAGDFVGGAILPGLRLALASLARGTAQLPEVRLSEPERAIGTDTAAAIRSGVVLGHLGAIRELVERFTGELAPDGRRPVVVATGGITFAGWAREALLGAGSAGRPPIADVVDPDLLLRSLDLLASHRLAATA
ncbi:MAG: type III pantothenate kinase [Chloroflexota bacterium]